MLLVPEQTGKCHEQADRHSQIHRIAPTEAETPLQKLSFRPRSAQQQHAQLEFLAFEIIEDDPICYFQNQKALFRTATLFSKMLRSLHP
jgi:hypothetical protein